MPLDLPYFDKSILQSGDFGSDAWLVQPLYGLVYGVGLAVIGVEHFHLRRGHWYCTPCWWVRNQIYRLAIPGLSPAHTADDFLTLLAIEDVLGQYSCRPFFRGSVVGVDVEGVVSCGCGVVWKEGETRVVRVIVLFVSLPFIIDGGVKSAVGEWLS